VTGLRFTVLGSGTAVPDAERGPAGFLVQWGGGAWLVDGGSGTLQRCVRAGVDPRALTGGFYSHHHPDHCGDLVPLLFAMRVGPPPRVTDYPIVAGAGFAAFFERLQAAYGSWITPGRGAVQVRELSLDGPDGVTTPEGLVVRSLPAVHSAGAVHLRFEAGGRSVVFSGDTAWSDALVELATGADLLVCECAGADDHPVEGHLAPSEVRRLAERARPGAVWLTHLYPFVEPELALATVAASGVPCRRAADLDPFT
jgi:ribonuclease BN (tRNA processing enzyme)